MADAPFQSLNQMVLAKEEASPGVDSAPTPAANAVLVENPSWTPTLNTVNTNEVTGSLDAREPRPGSASGAMSFDVYLKGGGGGDGAIPPEFGPLLKACGFAETINATAVTGTAAAGATGSITLAAGASAVNNFYRGFVIQTSGGAGSGQTRMIAAYNGTTKVATVTPEWDVAPDDTTEYTIPKQVRYSPSSSNIPTLSMYRYFIPSDNGDARLERLLGAAGNVRMSLSPSELPRFSFEFQGQLAAPADVAKPDPAVYSTAQGYPWIDAEVWQDNNSLAASTIELDLGNEVNLLPDPRQVYGFQTAGITRRRVAGRLSLPLDRVNNRNVISSWAAGTAYKLATWWGPSAGQRFAILLPSMIFTGMTAEDVQGYAYEGIPFNATGADASAFLVTW
ncbi:MAG TPA: hypothetical protein VNS22_18895 [Geminicoccus sp.]|uniref:hypothetical protein n=1 Tax=Geminicoccus sp. TaxID=2024832 RepID=UPI002CCE4150|nr:hypothetical protein [Geminicoccus sp.]HWL70428.1 hypothetical protein [Geminicoccus sp.]